ncbi:MAG TPA: hypothetical protein IAB68_00150 [Candidatus Aphodocola excrementigallinarum]|uniref:SPOR domain-containing protein n=1 Tax=Candidatus Aphodocola excrementigallinarum TaxID=2840670 RepID=A0A9D1LHF6_9FIRM|nr:hypothetical protein [Candidatus Aphodocola excrementigallinarum]
MKKTIIGIIIAILAGVLLAKLTFDKYEKVDTKNVISYDDEVYMLKVGSYDSVDEMQRSALDFERYIYIEKEDKVTVYIGIAKTRENMEKIKNVYDDKKVKTTIENVTINNDEFIQNLNEYEKLLDVTEDANSLLIIENQILSCYEDIMVNYE